jgi:hypothetical protein
MIVRDILSRISHLEKRLDAESGRRKRLAKTVAKMYVNYYGWSVRRKGEHQVVDKAKHWQRILAKMPPLTLKRFGRLLRGQEKGKNMILLDNREICLLRLMLSRRSVFSPRKVQLPLTERQ